MPTPRRMIIQGPAVIDTGGQQLYSKDNIGVKINVKTEGVMSESIGQTDFRDDDTDAEITFTNDGQVTADILQVLFPYFAVGWYPGMSIFPEVDAPTTIWTRSGYKYSFNNTALSKQPDFFASAVKTIYGPATIRALKSDNTPASAVNSLVTITKADYPGDAAYNRSNIITSPFAARWLTGAVPTGNVSGSGASPDVFTATAVHNLIVGDRIIHAGFAHAPLNGYFLVASIPTTEEYTLTTLGGAPVDGTGAAEAGGTFTRANAFDSFSTEAGFTVASALKLTEVKDDDGGVIDLRLDNDWLTTSAKCTPVGPTPDDIIAGLGIQGGTAGRGQSRNSLGRNLYLSGTGIYLKMINAFMNDSQAIRAGAKVKRIGETTFMSTPSVVDGVLQPPALLSTEVIA